MSSLTRILNNQITNSTIVASQKIAAGTITGSLFASNVTVPGDFLVTGNLFVLGTSAYTTIASTNTYVNDPLIVLNNGFAGTNTYDEGLIFNRGSLQNRALIWSEFNQEFRLIGTTETGTTYGNVTVSNYQNLHLGNLTVDYTANVTNLNATGYINTSGNVSAASANFGSIVLTGFINTAGNISGAVINGGAINSTGLINTSGNISASEGSFATVTATGLINTTGNISTAQLNAGQINTTGNVVATVFNGGSLNVNGNVLASTVLAQLVTADDATFGNVAAGFIGNTGTAFTGASINLSGNVLASSIIASYLSASTATVGNIAAVTIGNTGAIVQGLTARFDGNVIGGLAQFAAINSTPIGNATASTGAFTTLSASQNFYANASIATTTQGTGAIVVPNGGISVSGAANIAGAITTAGAAQFNNTVTVGGSTQVTNTTNATDATGTTGALQVAGGASIAKDLWVGGNLYAANIIGVTANVITVQDPLLFLAPDHTFPYDYDIGIYSSFTGTGLTTAGNVLQHTGVVRHNDTNTWVFASNLATPGAGHLVLDSNTVYDPIKAGNLELATNIPSTSTSSGALIVAGGAGIAGTVVAGQLNSTGNVLGQTGTFNTLQINGAVGVTGNVIGGLAQFAAINSTPIGNASASTGAFTTLRASAGIWANSATDSTSTTTGSIVSAGGLGLAGNIFQGGAYHDTSATNALVFNTPTTVDAFKAATTLNIGATSGTLTINNPTVVGTQTTQALYNTVTDTLNFARAANITMGHTDGTTTLQGNANVRAVTGSTSFTRGALVVAGGAGIAGNLNVKLGQQITIGIEHPNANIAFPERQIVAIGNINAAAGMNLRNMSTGNTASTNYIAVADNNVGESNFVNMGIAGSGFTQASTKIKANDGYIQIAGGNLHIAGTTGKDVTISSTLTDTDIGIIVSSNHANVSVQKTSDTTSSTTGAFTVVGGVGIGKKLAVGKGAEFNTLNSTDTFQINSSISGNVALFANVATTLGASTEYVVVGGGNTVVQPGVTLKVGSISTMMLPVGPTAARPSNLFGNISYDVPGMIRFNSTINNMEFYDGTQWQVTGSTFTVISGRQFSGNVAGGFGNVDGTNTTFTLQANATTASTIISINGVLQFPTLAYSVTGDQLTFTEPPAPNDVIDARILTTTSTVESIASGNGLNQFIADDAGAQIWTGTASTIKRLDVDTGGNINIYTGSKITYDQTPTQVINTNLTLLDRFSANAITTAKYVISMKQDTGNVQAMEALLTQSTVGSTAGTAYVTTYGVVNTGNTMGTLAANVDVSSGWVVNLWLIPNAGTAISNVKVMTNYIV